MALTVRPDDEVYQFDTVWLGPDEYTLPVQARYVAWGTWLACFMVAAVVLIPLGGNGPAGVFGSLIWSLGLSVVLSRAVMLVVDHERPLRSLPALFSAEARAAVQARRRGERSLLVRPGRIRVRETPPKVLAMRERQRSRAAAKAEARAERTRPAVAEVAVVEEPAPVLDEPARTADSAVNGWHPRRTPAWSIRADEHDVYEPAPVPVPVDEVEVREFVRAPDPETAPPTPQVVAAALAPEPVAAAAHQPTPAGGPARVPAAAAPQPAPAAQTPVGASPFRADPHEAERPATEPDGAAPGEDHGGRQPARRPDTVDPHAALEARILLPARKDR
jgi:hypothetical protein